MTMNEPHRICISTPPDREKPVAEIFFKDVQWAEINQEEDVLNVEFYPRPDGEPWRINLSNAIKALEDARRRLVGE